MLCVDIEKNLEAAGWGPANGWLQSAYVDAARKEAANAQAARVRAKAQNKTKRERYANDPVYRAKRLAESFDRGMRRAMAD